MRTIQSATIRYKSKKVNILQGWYGYGRTNLCVQAFLFTDMDKAFDHRYGLRVRIAYGYAYRHTQIYV